MKFAIFFLAASGVLGCSDGNQVHLDETQPDQEITEAPRPIAPEMAPLARIADLAGKELWTKFSLTPFDWSSGPIEWNTLNRSERSAALGLSVGSLVREQYGDNVRIVENYYAPGQFRYRFQEELRNGQWITHGPEVYWSDTGEFEILFRIDGEIEGPRVYYDADGAEQSRQIYKAGFLVN